MVNRIQLQEKGATLIYIVMQTWLLFALLQLLWLRIEEPFLPSTSAIWLFATLLIMFFPLGLLQATVRVIWLIVAGIAAGISGVLIFEMVVPIILLILGAIWFIAKGYSRHVKGIDMSKLMILSILGLSICFFLFYFLDAPIDAVNGLLIFLVVQFFLRVLGACFDQWWGPFLAFFAIGMAGLAFSGFLLKSSLGFLFDLFKMIYGAIVAIVLLILEPIILFFLGDAKKYTKLDLTPPEETGEFAGLDEALEKLRMEDPIMNLQNLFPIFALGVAVIFVGIFLFIYLRRVFKEISKEADTKDLHKLGLRMEKLDRLSEEEAESSLWNKIGQRFWKNREHNQNPVRRQFRQLLISLRDRGIWTKDSMSIKELNQKMELLKRTSPLYEKVRYGEQELTLTELEQFEQELKEFNIIMNKLPKQNG